MSWKIFTVLAGLAVAPVLAQEDPHLWLEDVDGDAALDWVRARNSESEKAITADPSFEAQRQRIQAILDDTNKIAYPTFRGKWVDNFWQDQDHVRGIWRRTTPESFRTANPEWRTLLDLDALGAAEGESWVWKGVTCLEPEEELCLVRLSRGGGDAVVVRELDTVSGSFVDGGFVIPEAKTGAAWRDRDTLLVGTDFGPGSLTDSGYPRTIRVWKRGTALADAPTVFEGEATDVAASAGVSHSHGRRYEILSRAPTFFTQEHYLVLEGRLVKLDLPRDIQLRGIFHDHLLVSGRSTWSSGGREIVAGALAAVGIDGLLRGAPAPEILFTPSERVSLSGVDVTADHVIVSILDNVKERLEAFSRGEQGWSSTVVDLPRNGSVGVVASSTSRSEFYAVYTDYLTPTTLTLVDGTATTKVRQLPSYFEADGLAVEQYEATSKDGTKVPYFLVGRADLPRNGKNPTLLYGYGGFQVSQTPGYSATTGAGWLERGGVYVVANIRGGGEFGPDWHRAALKQNRQRAFDDFIAVAEDLIARRITTPEKLGIMGGSNGGLLVGAVMTQRPDLFGAVVCLVPLLDMQRYSLLLAGASWIDEYGDPADPIAWEWIKAWSPYHNLREGVDYPKVLFRTSTRDDRVHPGHARKMAAKMLAAGHDVDYWENIEGGHGGAADNRQRAFASALDWTWLGQQLGLNEVEPAAVD